MNFNNLNDRTKGILFLILSAFGFAMMSAFVKLSGDLPSFQKTFFRNIVSSFIALICIIKTNQTLFGHKENRKVLLLRSIFGTAGIFLNFYAIDMLVLSDANMLNKLNPFFIIIFSAVFLKEKINLKQLTALLIAFIGTLLIIKPTFSIEIIPAISGLASAIFAAAAYTCIRFIGKKEHHYTIVFFFSIFSTVVALPLMLLVYTPMTFLQLIYLLLAGTFATVGQFGITLAYKYAPAKEISIFDYSNIIFSAIISLVLFGVLPDYLSVIGYIIIFTASLSIFIYNNKVDKNLK